MVEHNIQRSVLLDICYTPKVSLRKHAHMIYSNFFRSKIDNFHRKNFDIFLIFAQNIDCGYTLGEAVLTSTHNLCFGAKIRKIGIPLHTPVLLYKSGVQRGIHIHVMSPWYGSGRFGFHFREIGVYFREIMCRHLKCAILHVFMQHHHFFCQI